MKTAVKKDRTFPLNSRLHDARSERGWSQQNLADRIGTTPAAAGYAFRYAADYADVFWVLAATRDTLVADFVRLAERLDLPEKDEQDQQQMVTAVKRWLAAHEGWLLILDNADDLRLA